MGMQDAFALSRSDLNGFLFADIGVESSGMVLSVISALARQGLDPWQEAGRLAKLPRTAATDGLARLIAAMPGTPWPMPDATAIAARLVVLLPRHGDRPVLSPDSFSFNRLLEAAAWRSISWMIIAVVTVAVLAGVAASVAPAPAGPAAAPPATSAPFAAVPTRD